MCGEGNGTEHPKTRAPCPAQPRGIYLAARFLYDSDPLTWALLPLIVDFLSALPAEAGGPGCERGSWGCPCASPGGEKNPAWIRGWGICAGRQRSPTCLGVPIDSPRVASAGSVGSGSAWVSCLGAELGAADFTMELRPPRPSFFPPPRPVRKPRGNNTIFQRN